MLERKVNLSIKALIIFAVIAAVVFWILRTEGNIRTLKLQNQAVINFLSYNLQQGQLKQIPQQNQAQPQSAPVKPEAQGEVKK